MKRLTSTLVVLILALFAISCGGAPEPAPAADPEPTEAPAAEPTEAPAEEPEPTEAPAEAEEPMADEPITLTYYGSFGGLIDNEVETANACAEAVGITVESAEVAGGVAELMTELRALNTAGDMPDVFWMSSGFVDEFAADGLLLNMQPYVDLSINPDDYFTAAFAAGRSPNKVDSDMYSFPLRLVETVLYYNIDMFDAAGIDYPNSDWTWDDFLTAADALTFDENGDGLTDQYGYYFFGRYAHVESWVYQNGGRFLNADRTAFVPNENAIEAMQFLDSLIDEHGVAPQPAEMDGVDNPFGAGIAAMWIDGSWNVGNFPELNYDIAAVPAGPNGDSATAYGWSDMVSIAADTSYPDESFAFVQCLSESWTAEMAGGGIPIYRDTAFSDEWLKPDQSPPDRTFLLEWADNVGPTTFTPGWGEWRGYVGGAGLQGQLDEAFNGNLDINEAVAAASGVANEVLGRYYDNADAIAAAPVVESNNAEPVTLTYYGSFGGLIENEVETANACGEAIGATVESAEVAGGVAELMTELRALNTAGDMPDVFWMSSGFVDEFAADGLLLNMQPFVDDNINPDDYFTAAFAAGRSPNKVDSDMYSFPLRLVETVLYYNIDMFDAAGLEYPNSDWTWDDFLAAAEALTFDENGDGLTDQYGYYFFGRYAHVESWVYQNGGRFLNADRTAFVPDENAIEAMQFLGSLIDEYGVAPQPAEMDGVDNPFGAGIAAMWIDGSWNVGNFPELNYDIAAVPAGPGADGATAYGWSDMVSIAADTENPEAAFAFVQCLAENWTAEMAGGGIPIYRDTAFSDEWLKPDQSPPDRTFLLEWADNVGPTTFTPGWGEWRGYVGGAGLQGQLDEAFNGNQSVSDAVDAATEVANEVLGRYYGE